MSESIAIPKRKGAAAAIVVHEGSGSGSGSGGGSSDSDTIGSSYSFGTPPMLGEKRKSKLPVGVGGVAVEASPPRPSSSSSTSGRNSGEWISPRRPSLLGNSLSKSEYTVINLAQSDGPPRLVTCVKSSQGFDWNQELFLPSYADHDSHDLEHRPDPVDEIVLTDEEAAAILPQ